MNQQTSLTQADLNYQTICLVSGQILFTATTFFWTVDGRYTTNASTIMFFSMLFWSVAFMGLFNQLKSVMPIYAKIGLLYALYGTFGGAVFSVEGIFENALEIRKIGLTAADKFPLQMNLVMFQSGPAFPISLIILGIVLPLKRKISWFSGIFLAISGLLFPAGRIARSLLLAHITDFLLLAAVCWLSFEMIRNKKSAKQETP
jgi:hypothetical protein